MKKESSVTSLVPKLPTWFWGCLVPFVLVLVAGLILWKIFTPKKVVGSTTGVVETLGIIQKQTIQPSGVPAFGTLVMHFMNTNGVHMVFPECKFINSDELFTLVNKHHLAIPDNAVSFGFIIKSAVLPEINLRFTNRIDFLATVARIKDSWPVVPKETISTNVLVTPKQPSVVMAQVKTNASTRPEDTALVESMIARMREEQNRLETKLVQNPLKVIKTGALIPGTLTPPPVQEQAMKKGTFSQSSMLVQNNNGEIGPKTKLGRWWKRVTTSSQQPYMVVHMLGVPYRTVYVPPPPLYCYSMPHLVYQPVMMAGRY